jgi:hypothetical protein
MASLKNKANMNYLKALWEASVYLFPFLPKKTIGKIIIKWAYEHAQRTDNTWDDAIVDTFTELLRSKGWYPTEKEIVAELEGK